MRSGTPLSRPVRPARPVVLGLVAALVAGLLLAATATPARADGPTIASRLQAAVNTGSARGERVSAAIYDRATDQFYGAGDVDAFYASASTVKVAIAVRLLVTGQMTGTVADQAYSMITRSDDDAATALYGRVGGDGVMPWVAARYGLGSYFAGPTSAGWWGLTRISAHGMVLLYDRIADDPVVAPWLLGAMAAAQCTAKDGWPQCFGIPSATSGWRVKQGWMCCLDNRTRMHSTGFVQGDRFTVAVLTEGSTGVYGQFGRDTVTLMAQQIMPGGVVLDPHDPVGAYDVATYHDGAVGIAGWTFDSDAPSSSIAVHLYEGGTLVGTTTANRPRADVDAAYGITGDHGYAFSVPGAAAGVHTYCTYAIGVGAGSVNPQLGCRTVTVAHDPTGYLDSVTRTPGTPMVLKGWAFDPDATATALTVHVYVDDLNADVPVTTTLARPDVDAAYGITGVHGYAAAVTPQQGSHTYCAYAIDVGPGGNVLLGCRTVAAAVDPVSNLDRVAVVPGGVRVAGWTFDPDAPSGPSTVHVYVDGVFATAARTDIDRPDVDAAYRLTGIHGFGITVPATGPGSHTYCAYSIDQGPGQNTLIGCRSVTS